MSAQPNSSVLTWAPGRWLALALAGVALAGAAILSAERPRDVVSTVPSPIAVAAAVAPASGSVAFPAVRQQRTDRLAGVSPVGLDVPAIGVRTSGLEPLQPDAGGILEAPSDPTVPGWSQLGSVPGAPGAAVIAGHVGVGDTEGVFARLGELTPGAEVVVRRADGTQVAFTAYRVERFARDAFPADEVVGPTAGAELRLISWGGVFDRGVGAFADNLVVFARPAA